jgi:hypothetical protein
MIRAIVLIAVVGAIMLTAAGVAGYVMSLH